MRIPISAALAFAVVPVAACGQPVPQSTSVPRPAAKGSVAPTEQAFVKRHAAKLLARDTDGDGKISRPEFLAAGGKGNAAKRFTKIDRNADGLLDTTEIDGMLKQRFGRLDADGDGKLTAAERSAARTKTAKTTKTASDGSEP